MIVVWKVEGWSYLSVESLTKRIESDQSLERAVTKQKKTNTKFIVILIKILVESYKSALVHSSFSHHFAVSFH